MNQEQIDEIALKILMDISPACQVLADAVEVQKFARRLVEEIQARNEPIYLCWESGAWVESSIAEYNKNPEDDRWKLYIFPPTCEDIRKDAERYHKGLTAIAQLISESYGVAGLHRNGEVAPWEELRTGGRFEDWLLDFDNALAKENEDERKT